MLLGLGKSVLKYKIKLFKLERRLGKKMRIILLAVL